MGVTIDEVADEVRTKMKADDEFAESVVKAIKEDSGLSDQVAQAMTKDTVLTEKVTEHLLSDDSDLLKKVRGELEAENFHIESGYTDEEYSQKQAATDFEILCKAAKHDEDPEKIAKNCGVEVSKTMQETDFSNAGVLIPERILDEVIPILTANSVFVDSGAVQVQMQDAGKVGIGRQNQDPTASRGDENATIATSDADFDKLQLDAKKLRVAMAVSNDFLRRDAIISANDFLANRMMVEASNKAEQDIFRGSGGQYTPQGLLTQVDSNHVNTSSGNTISDITDDFREAVQLLEGANVPEQERRWFMRRDTLVDFVFDIDSDGDDFPFREELTEDGTMFGDPVRTTNNIEKRTNDTNIYYVEMSEQYYGIATEMELSTSEHQRFLDDETLLKLVMHDDFKMKHDESAAVVKNYTLQTA